MDNVEDNVFAFYDSAVNNRLEEALIAAKELCIADLADALEALEPEKAKRLLERLPNRADVFVYFEPETQMQFARELSRNSFAHLISEMPADDRADVFKQLDQEQRDTLLPALAQAEREDIRKLSAYVEGTAGALMTSDYATLKKDMNVVEALAALRLEAPDAETIYHAYVIDKDRKLIGVVSLRGLILANPGTLVNDLMVSDPVHCKVSDH